LTHTEATPNSIQFVPNATAVSASGGIFYCSSSLSGTHTPAGGAPGTTTGTVGSIGGKGANSKGAVITGFSAAFSLIAAGTGETTTTAGNTPYLTWQSVSDTVNTVTSQGRVVGGWVNITSASIPAAMSAAITTDYVNVRVIVSGSAGVGTLPSASSWYNGQIANATVADFTATIFSCWGTGATNKQLSCNFTFVPPNAVGATGAASTSGVFYGFNFTAQTANACYWQLAGSPTMPTTLAPVRVDIGFSTAWSAGPTAVAANMDYGILTAVTNGAAGCVGNRNDANVNPDLGEFASLFKYLVSLVRHDSHTSVSSLSLSRLHLWYRCCPDDKGCLLVGCSHGLHDSVCQGCRQQHGRVCGCHTWYHHVRVAQHHRPDAEWRPCHWRLHRYSCQPGNSSLWC
jgi:hypothetical protein